MGDNDWPVLSVEEAFSNKLYRPPADRSVERLVIGLLPDFDHASNLHFPTSDSVDHLSAAPLVIDNSKTRKKSCKKVKFASNVEQGGVADISGDKASTMSLEQASFDVRKFSIDGYEGSERDAAKVHLALKLGAKKPKRKGKAYDELKEELKQKRAERVDRRLIRRKEGVSLKKVKGGKVVKKKKRKAKK